MRCLGLFYVCSNVVSANEWIRGTVTLLAMEEKDVVLLVLSILMCGFGLFAGLGNAATMTFIAQTPEVRKQTFGKLLFNMAVSG